MSANARVQRNVQSVTALSEMLQKALQKPADFLANESFFAALASQSALARFSDKAWGISASSLNTHKRVAGRYLDGGFDALDRLRISAKAAVASERNREHRSNKTDKAGLALRVKELEKKSQDLYEDLILLTLVFQKSLMQGKTYADEASDTRVLTRCKREQRALLDMLSIRKHPISTNVVPLRDEK